MDIEDNDAPISSAGRPCKYIAQGPEWFCMTAHKLALLGLTDTEIAPVLGVSVATFYNYQQWFPEFEAAIQAGKLIADAEVVHSLYRNAVGGKRQRVKVFQHVGEPVIVEYEEETDGDTTAQLGWMRARQRTKWNVANAHELSGPNGSPLNQAPTLDFSKLNQEELDQLEYLTQKALPNGLGDA